MEPNVNEDLASAGGKFGSLKVLKAPANPNRVVEWRSPGDLRAHPHWVKPLDSPEVDSVKNDVLKRGVIDVPLHVLTDGTILDGHVRWTWAQVKKIDLIPVLVFAYLDDDEAGQIRHMISASKRRVFLEVDLVQLALKLWDVLAEEGKANQKLAGKAGAARRHRLDGPEPPQKRINARNDAAKAIDRSAAFLAHARKLRETYLADGAPAWLLYSASVGAQQVLPLEKAYELYRYGVSVEVQQALVDEILAVPESERRSQARKRTNELLTAATASKEVASAPICETVGAAQTDVEVSECCELVVARPPTEPALPAKLEGVLPARAEPVVRRAEVRAAGEFACALGAALSVIEAKGFEVLARQLRALRIRGDADVAIVRRLHEELGRLLTAADQGEATESTKLSTLTNERAA